MAEFASHLVFLIGNSQGKTATDGFLQPRVFDKTGLAGRYTFILEYNCAPCAPLTATVSARDDPDGDAGGFPDLFAAVQKQLGLRLEKQADVPVDVIVVDDLAKTPTGN